MKLCKVENLVEGDVLARAIFTADYQILLADATELSADYIEKLKVLGISEAYIRDKDYDHSKEVVLVRQEIEEVFKEKVKDILEKHTYSNSRELQELSQTADHIILNILEETEVVEKVYDIRERSSDLYEHSINTCSLATLVALKLQLSREVVHDIGVGCLLHDLGLRYMTFDYRERKQTDFSAMETIEYKKHSIYGYTALKNETWISEMSKNIILYHHERIDGSGFPLKMKSTPVEARIVAICDSFDEMICGICCERVKVHEAIEYLKIFRGTGFDERIVDVFLDFIAVYPVGSHVLTNNGETGVVIRQNNDFSDRPVLRLIKDKKGKSVTGHKEIDLVKVKTVFIEKVLD